MSMIYPLYFVYERIFAWMQELYIICRNNILQYLILHTASHCAQHLSSS